MSNPLRGEASFELDGEAMTLVYNNEAFCRIEGVTGESFFDTLSEIQAAEAAGKKPKISSLRVLLWAGFQDRHPNISLADAGDMVMTGRIDALNAMSAALAGALPKAKEDTPANPRKRGRAGTGSN
jgi:hypothetical protein